MVFMKTQKSERISPVSLMQIRSYISNSEKVANFPLHKGELGIHVVSRGGKKFHLRPSGRVISEFEPTMGFHLCLSGNNSKYR